MPTRLERMLIHEVAIVAMIVVIVAFGYAHIRKVRRQCEIEKREAIQDVMESLDAEIESKPP